MLMEREVLAAFEARATRPRPNEHTTSTAHDAANNADANRPDVVAAREFLAKN
jgi:hypothetical protein